jgi:radical SAM protein with 4Fe4S-binding SPASM domain
VSRLKGLGVPLTVTTNGYLLENFAEFLIEQEVDKLVVSFETGTVGHPDDHQLLEKIRKLTSYKLIKQKSKPSIVLFMVMTQENILDLSSFFEKLKDLGVGEVFLSNLLPVDENQKHLVLYPNPEPQEIKGFKNELLLNVLMHKIRCKTAGFEIRTERSCDFVEKDAAVVRWDGEVAPCYRFLHNSQEIVLDNQKQIEAHSFGNIGNQNLLDIWNDREYAWFRFIVHHGMYPSCIDCPLRNGCEFIESTQRDCWGIENSCADCLWSRSIIKCP